MLSPGKLRLYKTEIDLHGKKLKSAIFKESIKNYNFAFGLTKGSYTTSPRLSPGTGTMIRSTFLVDTHRYAWRLLLYRPWIR